MLDDPVMVRRRVIRLSKTTISQVELGSVRNARALPPWRIAPMA